MKYRITSTIVLPIPDSVDELFVDRCVVRQVPTFEIEACSLSNANKIGREIILSAFLSYPKVPKEPTVNIDALCLDIPNQ